MTSMTCIFYDDAGYTIVSHTFRKEWKGWDFPAPHSSPLKQAIEGLTRYLKLCDRTGANADIIRRIAAVGGGSAAPILLKTILEHVSLNRARFPDSYAVIGRRFPEISSSRPRHPRLATPKSAGLT